MTTTSKRHTGRIERVQLRAWNAGISKADVAFRAYLHYQIHGGDARRHVGFYSFLSLLSYRSERTELVPFLESAIDYLESDRRPTLRRLHAATA